MYVKYIIMSSTAALRRSNESGLNDDDGDNGDRTNPYLETRVDHKK